MRRNGDRGLPGGDREILDRGYGFHRSGDRWLPDRWLGMPGSSVIPPPDGVLIASWPVANQNDTGSYGVSESNEGAFQAFVVTAPGKLHSAKMSLRQRNGASPTNLCYSIYASTGTAPQAVPTGSPLARSAPIDASTITTDVNGALYELLFLGANQINLITGVTYCLVFEVQGTNNFVDPQRVDAGLSWRPPDYAAGNGGSKSFGAWAYDDFADMIFYIYSEAP
jgi:hypothetical protein